jgi:murein DD-endopeptidase MepM/ murein hydrolase activator NlpD
LKKTPFAGPEQHASDQPGRTITRGKWLSAAAWVVAIGVTALAVYIGWQAFKNRQAQSAPIPAAQSRSTVDSRTSASSSTVKDAPLLAALPALPPAQALPVINRRLDVQTIIPDRPNETVTAYTVEKGDSVFEIAAQFKIKPESVLWANYDQLNDNPDTISLGMQLNIPPVDGVLYQWKAGDTVEGVAGKFKATAEDILGWPGNQIDLTDQTIEPGALVMVPGGKREFRQWVIPTIPRGNAGVSQAVYGAGACEGSFGGAYGSGSFIWPAGNHYISGNDYWNGHLGIDIAAGEGAPIYAADSGVVVFAGWSTGGYGNMVMIDHGNGYQTVYGHLSSVKVGCGQSVAAGSIIGFSGSTGNSTGAHLHFEVRYQGGFVSPWYVLPAP